MAIKSLADINRAFEDGRWHLQRFQKWGGTGHAMQWCDPTFSSGQPPYDARVGVTLQFTPCVAQKNDAIWFPSVQAGMDRHLASMTMWSSQTTYNGPASVYAFDLLGYYPMIDGDSTDEQTMDNTASLPRYTDGDGVQMVIVNHIVPAVQTCQTIINYTDHAGVDRSVTNNTLNQGQNLVCSGVGTGATSTPGAVAVSLANGSRGVRRVNSVTHLSAPGGLHCIYLIKPLFTAVLGDNNVAVEKEFVTKNGFNCPKILDGAWLGWFDRIGGASVRNVSWFGNFTFVWG